MKRGLFLLGAAAMICLASGGCEKKIVRVVGVSIRQTLQLDVGDKQTLVAAITPPEATDRKVYWRVDNPAVATIDQAGEVTGVGYGTATITVNTANGDKSSRCVVTVEPNILDLIPDSEFRAYISSNFDGDKDGWLGISQAANVRTIDVKNKNISSLAGIEYFTGLTYLDCGDNKLTSLDASRNTAMTDLACHNNRLTSLDISNNSALRVCNLSGNPGDGKTFAVKAWFDNESVPSYMFGPFSPIWEMPDGRVISIDCQKVI